MLRSLSTLRQDYSRLGYSSPMDCFSSAEARALRASLADSATALNALSATAAATRSGGDGLAEAFSGSRRLKPHLLFPFLHDVAVERRIVDAVVVATGWPAALLWESSFFIKEARDPGFVTWHQDDYFWGLTSAHVCTAWVAFTDSTIANGCLRIIPGTHDRGHFRHDESRPDHTAEKGAESEEGANIGNNMLSRGQVADFADDAVAARQEEVCLELGAGQFSLHHGRLLHSSQPNDTCSPRVGLALRFIAPDVAPAGGELTDYATLARGPDTCGHWLPEGRPAAPCDREALALHTKATGIRMASFAAAEPY